MKNIKPVNTEIEVIKLAEMLQCMYTEVEPLASKNFSDYLLLAKSHVALDYPYLYQDKGMFIVKDISSPVIDRKLWDGVSVYVKPEYRKTRVLFDMYTFMFNNFDGTIVGYVEANSLHEKVVHKRHKRLGGLYEINRNFVSRVK